MIRKFVIVIMLIFSASACQVAIDPIRFGYDACDNCKMKIMDPKFGGVITTAKGKTFKFDDVGCLLSYLKSNFKNKNEIATIQIIDYSAPEKMLDKDSVFFIQSAQLRSPMSSGIAAIPDTINNSSLILQLNCRTLSWDELKLTLE